MMSDWSLCLPSWISKQHLMMSDDVGTLRAASCVYILRMFSRSTLRPYILIVYFK